jgi:T5SS/PEP-CTERM-associated repeat protein
MRHATPLHQSVLRSRRSLRSRTLILPWSFTVRSGSRLCCLSLAVWLLALVAAPSHAADTRWRNPDGGTFSIGGNWNNGVPGVGDVAHFGLSTPGIFGALPPYTVNFTANATNNALVVEDDRVVFDLNGHVYTAVADPFQVTTRIGTVAGASGGLSISDGLVSVEDVFFVGSGGHGALAMFGNGRLQTDFFARIGGIASGASVNVEGAGSRWDHDGELSAGWVGPGTMTISAGGVVQNGTGIVGDSSAATGMVTVSGANSQWINSQGLLVGDEGNGTLNISAGGHVRAGETVIIGQAMGAVGAVTVDGNGSELFGGGLILVSSFGPGTGTLTVANGGTVSALGGVSVRLLGTLRGDGQIIGNVSNIGVVAPGLSPGTLHVTGSYTQGVQGMLNIELAGTTPGSQFDTVDISGSATLGGTLNVSLLNGFTPASGTVFEILHADSGISGFFDNLSFPPGPAWAFVDTGFSIFLIAPGPALPGDFNRDGKVDAADYVVWRKTDGSQSGYDNWRAHFGQTAGSGAGANENAAVPEPVTTVLLMFAAAAGVCSRRRRDIGSSIGENGRNLRADAF